MLTYESFYLTLTLKPIFWSVFIIHNYILKLQASSYSFKLSYSSMLCTFYISVTVSWFNVNWPKCHELCWPTSLEIIPFMMTVPCVLNFYNLCVMLYIYIHILHTYMYININTHTHTLQHHSFISNKIKETQSVILLLSNRPVSVKQGGFCFTLVPKCPVSPDIFEKIQTINTS